MFLGWIEISDEDYFYKATYRIVRCYGCVITSL